MTIAVAVLCLAAALGGFLAICFVQARDAGALRLVHAGAGVAGLIALVLAQALGHGPPPRGLAGFGIGAEIVLAIALLFGLLALPGALRGRRPTGFLVGTHATLAIGGIVMALALYAK